MTGQELVGYAIATEQFAPAECVELARHAEARGFHGFMVGDHFQPWVPSQGQAAHVWALLGALGSQVGGELVTGVAAPGYRMHPALMAQAAATLACLYPRRLMLGLGSGEALNEHVVAPYWPETKERTDRLFEAIELIDRLFSTSLRGKQCRFEGRFHRMERTRLWSMPSEPPPILVAAGGPVNARRAGEHADGLITVAAPPDRLRRVLEAFHGAVPEREPRYLRQVLLQVHLSWAPTEQEAVRNALEEWPTGGMPFPKADIRSPDDFKAMAARVRPDDFEGRMVISEDPDVHRQALQRYLDMGVDRIFIHNVGRNQVEWFDEFSRSVLPKLRR